MWGRPSRPAALTAFDSIVRNDVRPLMQSSRKLGGDVQAAADLLFKVVVQQGRLLTTASSKARPKPAEVDELRAPVEQSIDAMNKYAASHKKGKFAVHMAMLESAGAAFSWVSIAPTPLMAIESASKKAESAAAKLRSGGGSRRASKRDKSPSGGSGGKRGGSKRRKAGGSAGSRGSARGGTADPAVTTAWAGQVTGLLTALEGFVREHHTTGLVWASGGVGPASNKAVTVSEDGPSVQQYDGILTGSVQRFLTYSNELGDEIKEAGALVLSAFQELRNILVYAETHKQPDNATLQVMLKPMSSYLVQIDQYRESKRKTDAFEPLSAIADGIPALGWVTTTEPGEHVSAMAGAAQFYLNKVLSKYKKSSDTYVEWANTWKTVLTEMQTFVSKVHPKGLKWNPEGKDADAKSSLFSELSKKADGSSAVKLKKVPDDKRKQKPASSVVKATSPKGARRSSKSAKKPTGPPVLTKDGAKWRVENQNGARELQITDTNIKQSVYVFNCHDSVLQVKGKVSSIAVDGCSKLGLVFEDCVASCEVVNSQKIQVQTTGKVPTVSIDHSTGVTVFLSDKSLDTEIVTSKSSEMNLSIPKGEDMEEFPIPEQYKSTIDPKTRNLITEPVKHA